MRPRGVLRHLRPDTGFALIDAMVGVVITALTLGAIVTVSAAVSNAIVAQTTSADRLSYITSKANELAANPAAVSATVTTANQTIGAQQVAVSQVRVTPTAGRDIIRVAAPRGDAFDCSTAVADTPADDTLQRCVVSEVGVDAIVQGTSATPYTVTINQPGVDGATPATAAPGALATFTAPAGVTTVNWVVGVKPGAGAARLTITQGATVITAKAFETVAGQYLYGTLPVTQGQTYSFAWDGPAGTAHHFLIYK
jgi:hypothetical protein